MVLKGAVRPLNGIRALNSERKKENEDERNRSERMEISVFHLQKANNELFGRYSCPRPLLIVFSMFSTGLNIDSYSLSNAVLLRIIDLG